MRLDSPAKAKATKMPQNQLIFTMFSPHVNYLPEIVQCMIPNVLDVIFAKYITIPRRKKKLDKK